jgi:hypothetical protein
MPRYMPGVPFMSRGRHNRCKLSTALSCVGRCPGAGWQTPFGYTGGGDLTHEANRECINLTTRWRSILLASQFKMLAAPTFVVAAY